MKINEITSTSPWVKPSLKDIRSSATTLISNDLNYLKTFKLIKNNGIVVKIPYQYFLNNSIFEPYTKKDLTDPNLDTRVKRIVKGFKNNSIPMLLGTKRKGKIDIYDGFTRAGVAMALGIPIYAIIVPQ